MNLVCSQRLTKYFVEQHFHQIPAHPEQLQVNSFHAAWRSHGGWGGPQSYSFWHGGECSRRETHEPLVASGKFEKYSPNCLHCSNHSSHSQSQTAHFVSIEMSGEISFGERCQPQGLYLVLTYVSLEATFQVNRLQVSVSYIVFLCSAVILAWGGGPHVSRWLKIKLLWKLLVRKSDKRQLCGSTRCCNLPAIRRLVWH